MERLDAGRTSRDAVPDAEELLAQTRRLVPVLRDRVADAVRLGHLPDGTIADLTAIGLWRLMTPKAHGGIQASLATVGEVLKTLGEGCGATSWTYGIYLTAPYFVTMMSDAAQAEFFARPASRSCVAFSPSGTAARVGGGYELAGTWRFCTGQHHADWAFLQTIATDESGASLGPALVLVPRGELVRLDDWDVSGLRGTGSNALMAEALFVPDHRFVLQSTIDAGQAPSSLKRDDRYFQVPMVPLFVAESAATPLGLATAALDLIRPRLDRRGITYSAHARQSDATVTHFQIARAHAKRDQAQFHAARMLATAAALVDDPGNVFLRVRCRGDLGAAVELCREVVAIVQSMAGAGSISNRDPLRHVIADMEALSLHSFLLYSTNIELYGRVLCGLAPDVPYF